MTSISRNLHWISALPALTPCFMAGVAWYAGITTGLVIFLVAIGLISFLLMVLQTVFSTIVISKAALVIKRGPIWRASFEIPCSKLEGIGFQQTLLGQIFGFGYVVCTGIGGSSVQFGPVRDIKSLNNFIEREDVIGGGKL